MKRGMGLGLGPGHNVLVLDEDPTPLPGIVAQQPPNFRPMYCGQTAGWTKMPLGTEVGLGPGDIVFNGDPAPLPPKGAQQPHPAFRPMSIVAKRSPISATAEHLFVLILCYMYF